MTPPRLCTHQPEPQGSDFVPMAGGFDRLHQPANLLDALLVAVDWVGEAGGLGHVHAESIAHDGSGSAMGITYTSGETL